MDRRSHFYLAGIISVFILLITASSTPCIAQCGTSSDTNCQLPANGLPLMSDLSAPPHGVIVADDFVPQGDTLSQVCVWGVYLDPSAPSPLGPTGSERFDCIGQFQDFFRVRIYEDNGGLPGVLVAERTANGENVLRNTDLGLSFEQASGIEVERYTLTLGPAITGIQPGTTYWLEVANGRDRTPRQSIAGRRTCRWHWIQSQGPGSRGNQHCASGVGTTASYGGGSGYVYQRGSSLSADMAFCLSDPSGPLGFQAPPEQLGACCVCPDSGGTCSVTTLASCRVSGGVWRVDDPGCAEPCTNPAGDVCTSDVIEISEGLHSFDTSCATLDGDSFVVAGNGSTVEFGSDLWYSFTADCTGLLVASTCPTQSGGLDSVVALYRDPENPTVCACPGDVNGLEAAELVVAANENCNGLAANGAGTAQHITLPGECWMVRVGGAGASVGSGLLDVACVRTPCPPTRKGAAELAQDMAGNMVESSKNRFLSFSMGEPGRLAAVRVTFVDLPEPHDIWNGTQMWLGEPRRVSESPSVAGAGEPGFWASRLQCNPFYADWASLGVVHAYHEGVIPSGVYDIEAINSDAPISTPICYSDALELTASNFGDLTGPFDETAGVWTAANGSVDVVSDAVAVLAKFANVSGAPSKTRADLEPATPDFVINISDVVLSIDAFQGKPYPFEPSMPSPCP